MLLNAIYSEDSVVTTLDSIFLITLLNYLEIQRDQVTFWIALKPAVNEEELSLGCVPVIKKYPKKTGSREEV